MELGLPEVNSRLSRYGVRATGGEFILITCEFTCARHGVRATGGELMIITCEFAPEQVCGSGAEAGDFGLHAEG